MKYIILIAVFILSIQSSVLSQRGNNGNNGKIGYLKTELGLSDAQAEELENIFEELKNDSETTSREEKKKVMDEAIAEVLTEDQLIKFEELKSNGKRSYAKRGKGGKRGKGMRKGVSKDEETLNRLKEMRTELDESISEEDKILIDELRQAFAERKEEEKNEIKEERKASKEIAKADIKELKGIAEKYESEIKDIFEKNKEFFDQKKAEIKEEWKEKKEEWKEKEKERMEGRRNNRGNKENKVERKHPQRDHAKSKGGHLAKGAKFLLLDPDALKSDAKEIITDFNTISVSPNPASVMTNVTYEVKNAGQVRVEIRDESGRIYDVLVNETLEAGTYTKAIETSKYQDKTYYISITDSKSIKTEKLLIQK